MGETRSSKSMQAWHSANKCDLHSAVKHWMLNFFLFVYFYLFLFLARACAHFAPALFRSSYENKTGIVCLPFGWFLVSVVQFGSLAMRALCWATTWRACGVAWRLAQNLARARRRC